MLQPNKMYNKVTLKRDFRRVAKAITKETADNFYRPDLKKGAQTLRHTPSYLGELCGATHRRYVPHVCPQPC